MPSLLGSELWLPARQRLVVAVVVVVAERGVLIQERVWPATPAAITLLLLTAYAEAAGVQTDQTHAFFSTRINRITGLAGE